jgi:hypothetical protein
MAPDGWPVVLVGTLIGIAGMVIGLGVLVVIAAWWWV